LVVVLGCPEIAQAQLRIAEPQNLGSTITCYVGGAAPYTLLPKKRRQFMPTDEGELQAILDKISAHTNLVIPIEVVAVENTDNAEACPSDGGKNYVAFKTEWLQGLYNETNNEWVIYAVLAHEIGHFALGHEKVAYKPELEEQADEYAGRILAMMGASLENTLSVFRSAHLRGIAGGKYPTVNKRIAAAKRGWESAKTTTNTTNTASNNTVKIEKQSNANAYYSKGLDWSEQKDYDKAIANFTAAITLDPNKAYYYYARGLDKKYGLKDYRGAIEDYTSAINLNPKDDAAYYARGGAKSEIKDYRGAIEDYTSAINIEPKGYYYYARGLTKKYGLKDINDANADFRKACEKGDESGCSVTK
jgi:tetratricopeptide (TPR) repeat protein